MKETVTTELTEYIMGKKRASPKDHPHFKARASVKHGSERTELSLAYREPIKTDRKAVEGLIELLEEAVKKSREVDR